MRSMISKSFPEYKYRKTEEETTLASGREKSAVTTSGGANVPVSGKQALFVNEGFTYANC